MNQKPTYEELEKKIAELEYELKSTKKYGLVWDKEDTKEDVVLQCENNIPVLIQDKSKKIVLNEGENNILIEGDNYHALTALNFIAKESIDVIYIDPPYNTGHEDFRYNDKYVDKDDGYRHSKWLTMMQRRLEFAKELLKIDGVIFVSIDDNEQANLKLLLDSIFGEHNFLANMVITSAPAGTQSSTDFAQQHSYCLVYRRSSNFSSKYIKLTDEELKAKYNYGKDKLGNYYIERLWKRGIGGKKEDVPSLHFPVFFNEETKDIYIDDEADNVDKTKLIKIIPYQTIGVLGRWTWSREKMRNERDYLIVTKVANEWKLHKKVYSTQDLGKRPYSIIPAKIGRTELGSIELKTIMNEKVFDYPKYTGFIKYLINLHKNKDAIVLDFFAGSGTTGQAVMELNKKDGGHRRFILCTNNENGICENVTYSRLKTVITGIRPDGSKYSDGLPNNLFYFKTDFVKDENNTEQARYCLVEKVDGLLCIAENIYEEVERNDYSSHYKSNNNHLFIFNDYYSKEKFDEFKQRILNSEGKKIVYIYSSDNNIDNTLIVDERVTIKPIPSKIYEIYKEIVEGIKRGE